MARSFALTRMVGLEAPGPRSRVQPSPPDRAAFDVEHAVAIGAATADCGRAVRLVLDARFDPKGAGACPECAALAPARRRRTAGSTVRPVTS